MTAKSTRLVQGLVAGLLALVVLLPSPASAATFLDCSARPLVPGADLQRCDLRPLPLSGKDVHDADMSRANLAGMSLDIGPDDPRTNLEGVRLHRAVATNTVFANTRMHGVDATRADLRGTQWEDAEVGDSDLSRADLTGAGFFFSSAPGSRFHRATLVEASLRHSNFDGADFTRANLTNADLEGAGLEGADLSRAVLQGVNFTDADVQGARFHQATGLSSVTWSNTTCPDGTNSDANGGTCTGHLES